MKILKLSFLLLFVVTAITVKAQEGQFVKVDSWKDLFAKAKKENKMVFIDSYFVGCHPCKQMDDEVFPLPAVLKLMNDNFISIKIDFLKEDLGKELQVKYGVTGFPTFLLLNSDGQLVSRFGGYTEADKFQRLLTEAMAKSKKGNVMKGFSHELTVNYPAFYTAMFKERTAIKPDELAAFLKGKDILLEENAVPLLVNRSLNAELSEYILKNYDKLEALYGKELASSRRDAIIAAKLKAAVPQRDDAKFETFLTSVKSYFSKEDWKYAKLNIAEEYYYKLLKDHKAFFKYAAANFNDDDNKVRYMAMYLYSPSVDEEEKRLFTEWMKLVVKENSSLEVLNVAVSRMKEAGDKEKTKQYATWGLKKAELLNKNGKHFQSSLN